MGRVEGEDLIFSPLGSTLHPIDSLIQDRVGTQQRIPEVQFHLAPLLLILYLMHFDHLEVPHVDTPVFGAGEADVMAEVTEQGVYGVGSPQLRGGDVHDPGHVPIGFLQLAVL